MNRLDIVPDQHRSRPGPDTSSSRGGPGRPRRCRHLHRRLRGPGARRHGSHETGGLSRSDDRRRPHPGAARPGRRAARPGAGPTRLGARRRDPRPRRPQRGGPRAVSGGLRRRAGPRPGGAPAGRRPAGRLRRAYDAGARGLRRDPAGPGGSRTVQRRRRAVRPRRLLAAAGPARTAASRTRRTRPSTCGWTTPRASPRPRSSTPTRPSTLRECCAGTARSGSPGRSPRASWRSAAAAPFDTSARLVELIRAAIPAAARRTGGNPAKRTFQALRIEVNDELAVLERALPRAVDALALGGRIVVMSYHSLEDRLAKRALVSRATSIGPTRPARRTR